MRLASRCRVRARLSSGTASDSIEPNCRLWMALPDWLLPCDWPRIASVMPVMVRIFSLPMVISRSTPVGT